MVKNAVLATDSDVRPDNRREELLLAAARLLKLGKRLAVAPPLVEFDFVSRHQGLEYVEAVRRDTR